MSIALPSLWTPPRKLARPSFNFIRNLMSPTPGRMVPNASVSVPTYNSLLATYNPILWWKLADASGSMSAHDSSAYSRTGTLSGTVTFGGTGPIPPETSAAFTGSTPSYVYLGGTLYTFATAPMTVIQWVNLTSFNPSYTGVSYDFAGGTLDGWAYYVTPGGYTAFYGSNHYDPGTIHLSLNTWTMLAWTSNGTTVTGYVNGVLDDSVVSSIATTGDPSFAVGDDLRPLSRGLYGSMAQIAVLPSCLTITELAALYALR